MDYSFLDDPKWLTVPEEKKRAVFEVLIDDQLSREPGYAELPDDKKPLVRDVFISKGFELDQQAEQERFSNLSRDDGSTLGALARTVGRIPENIVATGIRAVQGQSGASVTDQGPADKFVSWVDKRNKDLAQEYSGSGDVPLTGGLISKKNVAEMGPNLAYSGASLAGSVAGGLAGTPAGPAGIVAGQMAGGGAVALRATGYQVMQDWLEKRNKESFAKFGRPISPEEEAAFKAEFDKYATESGLWEAGPEAVGNALELALVQTPLGRAASFLPKGTAGKVAGGLARATGLLATEEATETITQMGQKGVEAGAGMTEEKAPDWRSPEDWIQSAKEVLPAVILQTGVMTGGGAAYRKLAGVDAEKPGAPEVKPPVPEPVQPVVEPPVQPPLAAPTTIAPEPVIPTTIMQAQTTDDALNAFNEEVAKPSKSLALPIRSSLRTDSEELQGLDINETLAGRPPALPYDRTQAPERMPEWLYALQTANKSLGVKDQESARQAALSQQAQLEQELDATVSSNPQSQPESEEQLFQEWAALARKGDRSKTPQIPASIYPRMEKDEFDRWASSARSQVYADLDKLAAERKAAIDQSEKERIDIEIQQKKYEADLVQRIMSKRLINMVSNRREMLRLENERMKANRGGRRSLGTPYQAPIEPVAEPIEPPVAELPEPPKAEPDVIVPKADSLYPPKGYVGVINYDEMTSYYVKESIPEDQRLKAVEDFKKSTAIRYKDFDSDQAILKNVANSVSAMDDNTGRPHWYMSNKEHKLARKLYDDIALNVRNGGTLEQSVENKRMLYQQPDEAHNAVLAYKILDAFGVQSPKTEALLTGEPPVAQASAGVSDETKPDNAELGGGGSFGKPAHLMTQSEFYAKKHGEDPAATNRGAPPDWDGIEKETGIKFEQGTDKTVRPIIRKMPDGKLDRKFTPEEESRLIAAFEDRGHKTDRQYRDSRLKSGQSMVPLLDGQGFRVISNGLYPTNAEHYREIKAALKSGELTPADYTRLHEKDYGPIEKFAPGVMKAEKPKLKKPLSVSEKKAAADAITAGQRRAAPGGEVGANGEWYEGGKFIANTDAPKTKKKWKKPTGRKEVEPGVWEVSPNVEGDFITMPLLPMLGGYETYNPDGTFSLNPNLKGEWATKEGIEDRKKKIEEWNRGGRWSIVKMDDDGKRTSTERVLDKQGNEITSQSAPETPPNAREEAQTGEGVRWEGGRSELSELKAKLEAALQVGESSKASDEEVEQSIKDADVLMARIKEIERPEREAQEAKDKSEREKQIQDQGAKYAEDVAKADVFRKINGWEIVKVDLDYVVRDPATKEEVYKSTKYKRAVEVANESKPETAKSEPSGIGYKLKINSQHYYQKGAEAGAQDSLLGVKEPRINPNHVGSWKKSDQSAYEAGYNAGFTGKYLGEYKDNKSILYAAVKSGDVIPVGWKPAFNREGKFYPEEVSAESETEAPTVKGSLATGEKVVVETSGDETSISVDMPKAEASRLTPKEQKAYLLAEIDKAMKANDSEWINFNVPGDGEFNVMNIGGSLQRFKELVMKRFPDSDKMPSMPGPGKPSTRPSGKRIKGEGIFYYHEGYTPVKAEKYIKADDASMTMNEDGFFSDGNYVVMVNPSFKPTHPVTKTGKIKAFNEKINAIKKNEKLKAEIKGVFYTGEGQRADSVYVHVQDEKGNDFSLNAKYVDAVTSAWPNAKLAWIEEDGLAAFETPGGALVGAVMPVRDGGDVALNAMQNFPIQRENSKPTPETWWNEKGFEEKEALLTKNSLDAAKFNQNWTNLQPKDRDLLTIEFDKTLKPKEPKIDFSDRPQTITVDGIERSTTNSDGKPIANTDEALVNFWRWFGDSSAVDEGGKPLAMYHGTDVDFSTFDKDKIKSNFQYSIGFHFADNPSEASVYADGLENASVKWDMASRFSVPVKDNANVMPVYLKALNPLVIKTKQLSASMEADLNRAEIIKQLYDANKAGTPYDSVIIETERNDEWFGRNIIVFDPKQVKSATGNRGSFSSTDARIDFKSANTATKTPMQGRVSAYQVKSEFADMIENVKSTGIRFEIVDKTADIDDPAIRQRVQAHEASKKRLVKGFLYRQGDARTMYVVAGNVSSMADAARTVSHELIGHEGLYQFLGEELNPFLDYVLKHPGYGLDIKKVAKERGIDFVNTADRRQAAKEWFAKISEEGKIQPSLLTKIAVYIKNALRKMGFKAEWLVGFTDKDIAEIIRGARMAVEGKGQKAKAPGQLQPDYQDVWHGTPHVWPPEPGFPHGRPRLDKIGTGEGAAAYGWGFYIADSDEVAKSYGLAGTGARQYQSITYDGETYPVSSDMAATLYDVTKDGRAHVILLLESQAVRHELSRPKLTEKLREKIEFVKKVNPDKVIINGGSLYKLDLPDSVLPRLLDWDNVVPNDVYDKIRRQAHKERIWTDDFKLDIENDQYRKSTGAQVYNGLSRYIADAMNEKAGSDVFRQSDKAASEFLSRAGIPGNKYLDGMSRGKGGQKVLPDISATLSKENTPFVKSDSNSSRGYPKEFSDFRSASAFLEKLNSGINRPPGSLGSDVKPSALKNKDYGHIADAKFIADLGESSAFLSHGFSGVDIPTQGMVMDRVVSLLKNDEIFNSVIKSIPVDVVDMFKRGEISPNVPLHNKPVFFELNIPKGKQSISVRVDAPSAVVIVTARQAAKMVLVKFYDAGGSFKLGSTLITGDNHSSYPSEGDVIIDPIYHNMKELTTSNYVIWSQPVLDQIALLERNGEKLDAMREAGTVDYSSQRGSNKMFQKANKTVDGRVVLPDVPNTDSISSSLDDYDILDGIREVPFSAFTQLEPLEYYSPDEKARTQKLASQIKESKEIKPLIVVVDNEGPYILEGGHRFDALRELGAKSFPAVVVIDQSESMDYSDRAPVTQTEAFKRWFKDSKVVDENGEPLVVYHGTDAVFNQFKGGRNSSGKIWGNGFYFTEEKPDAENWADNASRKTGRESVIMETYLSIQNPLFLDSDSHDSSLAELIPSDFRDFIMGQLEEDDSLYGVLNGDTYRETFEAEKDSKEIMAYAKDFGYDGVIGTYDNVPHYLVFESNQIKSIFNQNPTSDPRIDYSDSPADLSKDGIGEIAAQFIEGKPNTSIWSRALSLPLYYFKKIPQLHDAYLAVSKYQREKYENVRKLAYEGDVAYATIQSKFKKADPKAYEHLKKYLHDIDDYRNGYKVKGDPANGYKITEPESRIGVDEVEMTEWPSTGDTFATEAEAWGKVKQMEADHYRDNGGTDEGAEVLKTYRQMGFNMHNMLSSPLRKIIAEAKEKNLPPPKVLTMNEEGKKVEVNLSFILAQLGDLKGSYFPRRREPGKYVLLARKEGDNPIREHFDIAIPFKKDTDFRLHIPISINRRLKELKGKGYAVTVEVSDSLPESVFLELAGKQVALEAILNQTITNLNKDNTHTLKDLGIKSKWKQSDDGTDTFTIYGDGVDAKRHPAILAELGGEYHYVSGAGHGYPSIVFKDAKEGIETKVKEYLFHYHLVNASSDALMGAAIANEVADIIKGRGARSAMIARNKATGKDVWKGYEEDPTIAFAKTALGIAGATAKGEMAQKLINIQTGRTESWADYQARILNETGEKAKYSGWMRQCENNRLDPAKQTNAYNDLNTYTKDMLRNDEQLDRVMGTLHGFAVLKFLAFKVSSAAINLSSLPTSVVATMNGEAKIPIKKTFGLIGRALNDYRKYKFGKHQELDPWTVKALKYIEAEGWDQQQFNKEAIGAIQSKFGAGYGRLIELGMVGFKVTEMMNRVSTILGTYEGLRKAHTGEWNTDAHETALAKGKEVSDYAHGDYSKGNQPMFTRGGGLGANVLKSSYVFQMYKHNYLLNMKRLGFEEKQYKALAWMALSPMILAGAGAGVATPLLAAAAKAFGIGGDDPEEEFYKWVEQEFGNTAQHYARSGIVGMGGMGPSLSGSMDVSIPSLPKNIGELFGAPGGVAKDLKDAFAEFSKGNLWKSAEKALPTAFASPMKAYRESTEGLTTKKNTPIFYGPDQVKLELHEAAMRVLSFSPARITMIRERQWSEKQASSAMQDQLNGIYSKAKKLFLKPYASDADVAEIVAMMQEYNETIMSDETLSATRTLLTWKRIMRGVRRSMTAPKSERNRDIDT